MAVDGLDLEVRRGECFGLLGPNGAGKTTTVEICEGLTEPDAGEVRVLGESWQGDGFALRARLGIQLQETKFPEKLRVREVVALFRSFYPRGRSVAETLALVELQEKADAYVKGLSGGQKQRLSLGCALVGDPELLFLDEPTTGLDPQSRLQTWGIVEELMARGRTALVTTHYMEAAARLCHRVAIVDHGRLIALGTPREYSSRARGARKSAEAEAVVTAELAPRRRCSPSWARLIAKVYQVDPLVCTRCGQRMSILAFVSDQHSISRILEHLGLRPPELERPPPAREILRVAEQGEGWGVPANWD